MTGLCAKRASKATVIVSAEPAIMAAKYAAAENAAEAETVRPPILTPYLLTKKHPIHLMNQGCCNTSPTILVGCQHTMAEQTVCYCIPMEGSLVKLVVQQPATHCVASQIPAGSTLKVWLWSRCGLWSWTVWLVNKLAGRPQFTLGVTAMPVPEKWSTEWDLPLLWGHYFVYQHVSISCGGQSHSWFIMLHCTSTGCDQNKCAVNLTWSQSVLQ
jgi:hypothetical protein